MNEKRAVWYECFTPDATTDRGWLKALCAPFNNGRRSEYRHDNMPVRDDVPGGWREQSTLGNYLDYGPVRPGQPGQHVHCVCYAANTSRYVATVAEARAWIEEEALRVRPELAR